jgi:hypothetical protein
MVYYGELHMKCITYCGESMLPMSFTTQSQNSLTVIWSQNNMPQEDWALQHKLVLTIVKNPPTDMPY